MSAAITERQDWRGFKWQPPDPGCLICTGNPYWGKTLSSWERCDCVRRKAGLTARDQQDLKVTEETK